eukprot:14284147-Ditylum_brightwellii.AAC.1
MEMKSVETKWHGCAFGSHVSPQRYEICGSLQLAGKWCTHRRVVFNRAHSVACCHVGIYQV